MKTSIILGLALAMAAVPAAMVSAHNAACATTNAPHAYGAGGSVGAETEVIGSPSAGVVTVSDNNTGDCDGDGVPGDFDGDYEAGAGGGFFGAGPWANEPICQYGLKTHGTSVTVTDAISANIGFVTGADDQQGPVVIPDPVNGGNICETDGNISPGDPAVDPTADADDCLSTTFINSGTACGTGGDGGYWVFINGAGCRVVGVKVTFPGTRQPPLPDVDVTNPGVQCTGVPTTGFITA